MTLSSTLKGSSEKGKKKHLCNHTMLKKKEEKWIGLKWTKKKKKVKEQGVNADSIAPSPNRNNSPVRCTTTACFIFNRHSIILPTARSFPPSAGSLKQMGFVRLNGTFRHCNLSQRAPDQIWRKAASCAHCCTYVLP